MEASIPIRYTGIRDGEFITSNGKANQGTIIQIRGFYPPSQLAIREYPENVLIEKIRLIPFFKDINDSSKLKWLNDNAISNDDLYLSDLNNIKIKFIKIGGYGFTDKLNEIQINQLLLGNPNDPEGFWDLQDVYLMIPRKPGSRAKRHTLIFRPNLWKLTFKENDSVERYTGISIDLTLGDGILIKNELSVVTGEKIYITKISHSGVPEIGIKTKIRNEELTIDHLFKMIQQITKCDLQNLYQIKDLINWFPPSIHKSLIQKIIRIGPNYIKTLNGIEYLAELVLLTSFSMLLIHPGALVPDIQRFVTGAESALKRLAVSICEDSYTEYYYIIDMALSGALLIQIDSKWKPDDTLINNLMIVAIKSIKDRRMYNYSTRETNSDIKEINYYTLGYLLLNELKSFQTDIAMLSTINGSHRELTNVDPPNILDIVHCIDHHSCTDIAYYFDFEKFPKIESIPQFFSELWNQVTGINYRYIKYINSKLDTDFVLEIRKAQELVWLNRSNQIIINRNYTTFNNSDNIKIKYTLSRSWLAGLIGPIEVKVSNTTCLVTLRPDNIYEFIAIKRPTRDTKSIPLLSEDEKDMAISLAIKILVNGITLKNIPESLNFLKDKYVKIIYEEDDFEYYIYSRDGFIIKWIDLINLEYTFNYLESVELTLKNSLKSNLVGIQSNTKELLDNIVNKYDPIILQKVLTYIDNYRSIIEMNKISRSGEGQDYYVDLADCHAFKLISYLCIIYPSGIQRYVNIGFKIICGPLIWLVKDYLKMQIGNKHNNSNNNGWIIPKDISDRKLYEYQQDALDKLSVKAKYGKKGNIIWMPTGVGKTYITLSFIGWLIKNKMMPKYCVYTLPPSANQTIYDETGLYGLEYNILDPRKTGSGNIEIKSYLINFINHDHIRMHQMPDMLRKIAPEMLFVVDEFHKTLGKTIRTTFALEIARLSKNFICMSGTIIKDTNVKDLIKWTEQIVSFEVNENNYWVSINALISKRVILPINVNRMLINADLNNEDKYYSMVSSQFGGTNPRMNREDFIEAVKLCFDSCYQKMLSLCIEYIQKGEYIMLIAKDIKTQEMFHQSLINYGVPNEKIYLLSGNNPINLIPSDPRDYRVVIVTFRQCEGYNLTKMGVIITTVYFCNQSIREQLEGRIIRTNQNRNSVDICTVTCGILSHIFERYNLARNLSEAVSGVADSIGLSKNELRNIL